MTQTSRIALLSSDADLETALRAAFAEHSMELVASSDIASGLPALALEEPKAILVDLSLCDEDLAAFHARIVLAVGSGVQQVMLVPHDSEVELDILSEQGIEEYLSLPVHPKLCAKRVVALIHAQGTAGVATDVRHFTDRDGLARELTNRIPIVRNANTNLALLTIRLMSDGGAVDWIGMEPSERAGYEHAIAKRLDAVLEELGSAAPPRHDLRLAWLRPDTLGLLVGTLDRVQDVARIGGRLQDQLQRPFNSEGRSVELHTCIGIATCPGDGVEATAVIEGSHRAAEAARDEGRNALSFNNTAMGQWAFERLTLEKSLRDALANEELRVYYQPRIDIHTRQILGMEALVRWIHPQLGMVSPGQFIPLAEETGLITPIGEWVLREACRQNRAWRDAGHPPIRVSVNLSPVQFRDSNLHERVCEAIESTGLPKDGLELEVTESMLMNDPKVTIGTLRKLKEEGLKISIDDFGTGYSSLSYLKQFPIDSLKIDRSFVRDVTTNADDAAIATAIILMGHSLKLNVVAEGVETESQLAFLRVLQCNEIQGFLFSPPVPADKATAMLASAQPLRAAG